MRWSTICVVLAAMTVSAASVTKGAVLTYEHNYEFSGATAPAGAAPWLRATFDDGGTPGSVTLTFTAVNLVNQEFVRFAYFNLDPLLDPTSLVFSPPAKVGSFANPIVATAVNGFQADGDGLYDIRLEFANSPTADRFGPGESLSFTITGIPTLTAHSFAFLSAPAGGNGPFFTAAHVQGIGNSGQFSGWTTETPEPASLGLLALASLCLARRR